MDDIIDHSHTVGRYIYSQQIPTLYVIYSEIYAHLLPRLEQAFCSSSERYHQKA